MRDARERALSAAQGVFGESWVPTTWSLAPGRIELLGNHVDYNGGLVLAAAIDREVAVAVGPSVLAGAGNGVTVLASDVDTTPTTIDPSSIPDWTLGDEPLTADSYVRGMLAALHARGMQPPQEVTLSIAGDIPLGFGMSSSAAIDSVTS